MVAPPQQPMFRDDSSTASASSSSPPSLHVHVSKMTRKEHVEDDDENHHDDDESTAHLDRDHTNDDDDNEEEDDENTARHANDTLRPDDQLLKGTPLQTTSSAFTRTPPTTTVVAAITDDEVVATTTTTTTMKLEERVAELELKLATLARLLQTQVPTSPRPYQEKITSIPPPPPVIVMKPLSVERNAHNRTPYLESPCPHRRFLSSESIQEYGDNDDDEHFREDACHRLVLEDDDDDEEGQDTMSHEPPSPTFQTRTIPTPTLVKTIPTPTLSKTITPPPTTPVVSPPRTILSMEDEQPPKSIQQKWMDYLNCFQESTPDIDNQMEEFIKVPSQVEYLLGFGFWICVDCFLYVVTILPIRFLWSCCLLLLGSSRHTQSQYRFHRRHLYQLIQVGIIYTVYHVLLKPISIGKLYHWIRGQAMLKLYVLIAIVEVFDRLMCSLGQDCLDSMYWNTTRRPRSSRMIISILVVLIYAMAHTSILFVHVATLNVAMNSADHALLTLLISGNFAEIKSTVFKKYNKPNLFKITASDICERFKLALFLALVLVLNLSQGMDMPMVYSYVQMCGIVWCTEMLADWIKHSFITKFNFIPSTVYPEHALLLAGDVTGIGHEEVNLDHSHAVVKRIGLAQIPLVCVLARYLTEAARYAQPQFAETPTWHMVLLGVGVWGLLLVSKISLGSYLQTISRAKLLAAPELKKR